MLNLSAAPVNIDHVEVTTPYEWLNILMQAASVLLAGGLAWWATAWRYKRDKGDLQKAAGEAEERHQAELEQQKSLHEAELDQIRANSKASRQRVFLDEASAILSEVAAAARLDRLDASHLIAVQQLSVRVYTVYYDADRGFAHFGSPAFRRVAELISAVVDHTNLKGDPLDFAAIAFARTMLANEVPKLAQYVAMRIDSGMTAGVDEEIARFGRTPTFSAAESQE